MNAIANDTPDNAAPAPAENPASESAGAEHAPRQAEAGKGGRPAGRRTQRAAGPAPARHHPLLDQLATLYPALFGENLRPLKRGIFEDLLAAHPEVLTRDELKAALAQHARSSRYLTVVASGQPRHDLSGQPVEDLTPEQVHHALIEVFRRRGARSREDLRPKLRQRIAQAFEASGLSREAYAERVNGRDEEVNQITHDALEAAVGQSARDEALLRAFEASGKTLAEFADMYGLHVLDANRTLERARARARIKPQT
ncbi:ProQ/FinO family protein [Hydrogenophaga sp.]|uniref:ProQ/FinO family protein n=1 Tax=Hydrogenophaga sp. TaxID=1904254 RepID=UPI0025BAF2D8|nr:ProQ/FinO family protein [Hydrogenophaga sp.]